MPEQQMRLLADRYELIATLGRGTMGTVWRAHDRLLGRPVAVKEIRQDPGLSKEQRDELRERMIREGRTAAQITHPSVATVHDAIVVDGCPWIIMELVEARSLEQVIDEEGPLPPRLVAEIGLDLLGALGAAHEQGILHRDVKPGNVLVTETGRVVLTDFGIAKALGDSNITKTGMVIGSPGYTAPERARGDHTGPESDLWSLGATLYFAVEGRPAYERRSVSETLAALMTEQADAATQAGPLRPALEALLEKDHTKRLTYEKAVDMLSAVAKSSMSPQASSRLPMPRKPGPFPKPASSARPTPPSKPAASSSRPDLAKPAASSSGLAPAAPGPGSEPNVISRASANGPAAASEPNVDPDQTMMVIRPKGGLHIPGGRPPTAPAEGKDDQATRVGRLTPMPSAPPQKPMPPMPPMPPRSPAAPAHRPMPPTPGSSAAPAHEPVPQGYGGGEPADTGLGTDLFAFQGAAPPRGSSPAGMIILVAIALLGLAAIIMLVTAAFSNSGTGRAAGASVPLVRAAEDATGATTSASESTDPAVETGGNTSAKPAPGLRRHSDKTGFVIDVPWKLRSVSKGRSVGFSAAGDVRTVRISHSPRGSADVLGTVKAVEAKATAAGTYPGYQLIRLAMTSPAPYVGTDVADWEFTYSKGSVQVHMLSRWVAVPSGPSYAIYWSTPETKWRAHRAQLDSVLSSFEPARGDAPGGS